MITNLIFAYISIKVIILSMTYLLDERIEINPEKMVGKPVIKGTRITVAQIINLVANGASVEEILKDYPELANEDISAALRYASKRVAEEEIYPVESLAAKA